MRSACKTCASLAGPLKLVLLVVVMGILLTNVSYCIDFADNDSTSSMNFSVLESRAGNSSDDSEANVINAATGVTVIYLVIGRFGFLISDIGLYFVNLICKQVPTRKLETVQ